MTQIVKLDNVIHNNLSVDPHLSAQYGNSVNQALIFPNEMTALQKEYPIFFRKDQNGDFLSIILMGLDHDENLFLDDDGWHANAIPATHQAGPFSLSYDEDNDDYLIEIDLDNPRVNDGNMAQADEEAIVQRAVPIFLPQGGQSNYLQHVEKILHVIRTGVQFSANFFAALQALDLIQPVEVGVHVTDTQYHSIPDLYSINEEKFNNLNEEQLSMMHKNGLLALCYFILASRSNINALGDRKRARARP